MDNQPTIAMPAPPARPAFHHSAVQAVRPGTPLLFRLPVTGAAPLAFAVEGLPDGVQVDKATGIVSGTPDRPGTYRLKATARNARGSAWAELTLIVGETLAPVPPMGWNSYDGFGDSVTEQEVLENARYMAEKLQPYGWEYVVVDYRWYDPKARSSIANLDPSHHVMDEYGRLLPAENRFPSAASGKGFRPLADQVHAMGLKFGIHVMRGISRISVEKNLPIAGSRFRARDAADTSSTCAWNPDMYGVRGDTEAGQAWYDAIIRQYADWHVDFLKIDDLSAPTYHRAEVEAIRRAIARCGRSIVLSTSPGETPLSATAHVKSHANM